MKKITLLLAVISLSVISLAQDTVPEWKKAHFLSAEEMKNHDPAQTRKDFFITDPPPQPVRQIAEFERMQSVLVRYPFGIPVDLIAEISENCGVTTIVSNQSQENQVLGIYSSNGVNTANCDFIHAPSDSYWTRDYGPWFIIDGQGEFGIVNFPYNRPRPNDDDIPIEVADYLGVNLFGIPVSHTGGNYMTDGWGISSSTTLVYDENSISPDSIDVLVDQYLGINEYHCLPDPLGDYIEHIDCWGKFLDVDKVLIGEVPESDPRYDDFEYVADYFASTECSYGYNYEVIRVSTPGNSPQTPYTNSIIVNKKVFVPITGHPLDDEALEVYEEAMPGYEILGFYAGSNSWQNTDAIHCRTKGIVDTGMLHIKHLPLHGEVDYSNGYVIQANFKTYSGEPLYPDSLRLYYSINNGNFMFVPMTQQLGSLYKGTIPEQEEGSEISYYIHAADQSGRSENHPFIGRPDPHVFTVGPHFMLTQTPDTLQYATADQCIEGQLVKIYNYNDTALEIEDITTEGNGAGFSWFIDPWTIELPYTIEPQDSLLLNVRIDLPVGAAAEWLLDSLMVETAVDVYTTYLMFNNDIVAVENALAENHKISLSPNPFMDELKMHLDLGSGQQLKVDLISLNGRIERTVFSGYLLKGRHELKMDAGSLPEGVYILRAKIGAHVYARKVLKY